MSQNITLNFSSNLSYCELYQPKNPYCGIFGPGEIIEVIFLSLCSVVGSVGNCMVIFSIILEKVVHQRGNMFIINLAVADLIVTGSFLPTVIGNVIRTENILPPERSPACQFAGYIVTVTCACSVCNLALIALNRYWAVVRSFSYKRVFRKRNVYLMVVFAWAWPNLITSPTLFGWSSLLYDYKMAQCGWDDKISIAYNIGLMGCAIFLPLVVIVFCYIKLYKSVKERGKWLRSLGSPRVNLSNSTQQQRQLKKEINLIKTLAVTVVFFVFCWTPYGLVVLFFAKTVPPRVKKTAARLGLCNSVVNFIVYGVMNPVFRRGYKNLIVYICCCCRDRCVRILREKNPEASPARKNNIQLPVESNEKRSLNPPGQATRENSTNHLSKV
ncbi:unnamed protein product [Clavelina lepadiformis]|uniref:G-protein coupled receptors family 1 profile domain-containing protein n=1 Tax=Clavelina lepadiformis TaxID=159417 RepID=A0ABP0GUQ0_CLALP